MIMKSVNTLVIISIAICLFIIPLYFLFCFIYLTSFEESAEHAPRNINPCSYTPVEGVYFYFCMLHMYVIFDCGLQTWLHIYVLRLVHRLRSLLIFVLYMTGRIPYELCFTTHRTTKPSPLVACQVHCIA